MAKRSRNFCTMFYRINGNQKRSIAHYLRLLPETMKLLRGSTLYLYYQDTDVEEAFRVHARAWNVDIVGIQKPLNDLPTRIAIEPIISTCKGLAASGLSIESGHRRDKARKHYERDFLGSGEMAFRDLLTVWTEDPTDTTSRDARAGYRYGVGGRFCCEIQLQSQQLELPNIGFHERQNQSLRESNVFWSQTTALECELYERA